MCFIDDPKFDYVCQDTQELLDLYVICLAELSLDERAEVPKHLSKCKACRKEYAGLKHTHDMLIANRDYLQSSGVFDNCDTVETIAPTIEKTCEEINEERFQRRIDRVMVRRKRRETRGRIAQIKKMAKPIIGVAACLLLVFSIWAMVTNQNAREELFGLNEVRNQPFVTEAIQIELLSDSGTRSITAGELITTEQAFKQLTINGNRTLVLDSHTQLTIEPLKSNHVFGCLINLQAGHIQAHVEHDGKPFEVYTPNSRAVITGTTFDIQVQDQTTSLVVSEGSVRFDSDTGFQQVTAGHRSKVVAFGKPSMPESCQADLLMAWADRSQAPPMIVPQGDDSRLTDELLELPLLQAYSGSPIDLESLDYDQWTASQRAWFAGQFPWIFALQKVLTEKGNAIDYPELLIKRGDLWQVVYPERIYQVIPVFNHETFVSLSRELDLAQLQIDKIPLRIGSNYLQHPGTVTGLAALEQWLRDCRTVQVSCQNEKRIETLVSYSLAMGHYLENTRALAWLCIQNGKLQLAPDHKADMLNLLQRQIALAHKCKILAGDLSSPTVQVSCEHDEFLQRLENTIQEISNCEMTIHLLKPTVNYEP